MKYIVKYGEIFLKGKRKQAYFISKLIENIKRNIPSVKISKERGKLIVESDDEIIESLSRVFGVHSIAKFVEVERDKTSLINFFTGLLNKNESYKIEVKRQDKAFEYNSIEFARYLSQELERRGFNMSVKTFTKLVRIDVEKEVFRVYLDMKKGPGGYPYASTGKALVMFSGGFDSTLSLWLSARKGLKVYPFLLYSNPEHLDKARRVIERLKREWFIDCELSSLNLSRFMHLFMGLDEGIRQMVFKRVMYLISNYYASRLNVSAIVFGESLNQVHTQTLRNIEILQYGIDRVVMRPVLFMDKEEIVSKVRGIGLYDITSGIKEYCTLSHKPNVEPPFDLIIKKADRIYEEIYKHFAELLNAKRGEVG